MEKDAYCQELTRYIHLNPVRARVAERPAEYTWSSYRYFIGLKESPWWLKDDSILDYFDKDRKIAQRLYRNFVEKGLGKDLEDPLKDFVSMRVIRWLVSPLKRQGLITI